MQLSDKEKKENKFRRLFKIYFVIIIALIFLASLINLLLAYKIGDMHSLTFGQVVALHKSAKIERVYQGYEVIIMQRLSAALCYFLFGIAVATPFLLYRWGKLIQKRKNELQKK